MKKLKIVLLGLALSTGVFSAFASSHDVMPTSQTSDQMFDVKDASGGSVLFTGNAAQIADWQATNYPLCTGGSIKCTRVNLAGTNTEQPSAEVHKPS